MSKILFYISTNQLKFQYYVVKQVSVLKSSVLKLCSTETIKCIK